VIEKMQRQPQLGPVEILSNVMKNYASAPDPTESMSEQEAIENELNKWISETAVIIKENLKQAYETINVRNDANIEINPDDIIRLSLEKIEISQKNTFNEISKLLDNRFARFRLIFQRYKKKTLQKLQVARLAINEDRRVYDIMAKQREEDSTRIIVQKTVETYTNNTEELKKELATYKACFDNATKRAEDILVKFNELQHQNTILTNQLAGINKSLKKV
jgi:hypothetical protein